MLIVNKEMIMDRQLLVLSNALVESRVQVAERFQQLLGQTNKQQFAYFMQAYCRQNALLEQWMSGWNRQLHELVAKENAALAAVFADIAERLEKREHAASRDSQEIAAWLQQHIAGAYDVTPEKVSVVPGMKQLRFVANECIKRKHHDSWLLVMTEIERMRIIHGYTLVKMCEQFLGESILTCLSSMHYQHPQQNELFSICETALITQLRLKAPNMSTMMSEVKTALAGFASFISDCYSVSQRWVEHGHSTVS